MLVKLAFAMQRLKKISKNIFVMINKDGGGQFLDFVGGRHRAHGGSPQSHPTRENPAIGHSENKRYEVIFII